MTTTGELLVALSGLVTGSAMTHLTGIETGGAIYVGPTLDAAMSSTRATADHAGVAFLADVVAAEFSAVAIIKQATADAVAETLTAGI